jgi:penicillin-binding protein 1A
VNCAYVRLGAYIGLDKVVDVANRLGIPKERLKPYPSISLGAQEVSPLEMASAYAAIAADGVYRKPSFVEKVADRRGKLLFEGGDKGKQVIDKQYTRAAIQVMRQVVLRGTGGRAQLSDRQVAGKTGTSENFQNAWFVGFTPQLATAVWMGSPAGNISMYNVGGVRVQGGSYPARIWGTYMAEAMKDMPVVDFPLPNSSLIPAGRFINDTFSSHAALTSTTSSSSTSTTTPTAPPDSTTTAPPQTTAPPATTSTVPKTTTTTAPPKTTTTAGAGAGGAP